MFSELCKHIRHLKADGTFIILVERLENMVCVQSGICIDDQPYSVIL